MAQNEPMQREKGSRTAATASTEGQPREGSRSKAARHCVAHSLQTSTAAGWQMSSTAITLKRLAVRVKRDLLPEMAPGWPPRSVTATSSMSKQATCADFESDRLMAFCIHDLASDCFRPDQQRPADMPNRPLPPCTLPSTTNSGSPSWRRAGAPRGRDGRGAAAATATASATATATDIVCFDDCKHKKSPSKKQKSPNKRTTQRKRRLEE